MADSLFFRIKSKAQRLVRSHLAKSSAAKASAAAATAVPVVTPAAATSAGTSAGVVAKPWSPPPGPVGWPVIGSLHLLGQYEVPFEAFSELSKIYGDIFSITLGSTPCVVVNSFKLIKEVLITKGPHFGGRPNFIRYDILFGGDRDNSLALCDWSYLQRDRRSIARHWCHPRVDSMQFDTLSRVLTSESDLMVNELSLMTAAAAAGKGIDLKTTMMTMCANVFTHYMCSTRFDYNNKEFGKVVRLFDQIFWDINQGYAVDFLPWLMPVYRRHMQQLKSWGTDIRQFIVKTIIDEHRSTMDVNNPRDFTDVLLSQLGNEKNNGENVQAADHNDNEKQLDWNHVLYELEDFLGGHSAIGNLLMRAVGELCSSPHVMANIQEEIRKVTCDNSRPVVLEDRPSMPYTEATILETLRLSSSPIVPHVAMQNTSVAGYDVQEGTMVFLNNYELNISPDYWGDQALTFDPARFIIQGKIVKPEYFIPFSTGKRACMGYRLVQHVSFVTLATLLQNFDVSASEDVIHLPKACVAVPPDAFRVVLTPRPSAPASY
ncbi:ecdysone biosynthesis protein [Daphnia pulex]|uniref:Ecdysone biosynthesis protein n=1 Tax=Daphnia pulex TaxID=6669 RepID=E9FXA0_DAPPU|nr:ecdysone biosynthesis protein [Daphnia pulex]|eukprot:EFX88041.1 ecdysone biosynthesis protein [Daphnia pulex]